MKTHSESGPYSRTTASMDLVFCGGLTMIALLADMGIIEFSTPVLTACFFMAVAGVIFSKWMSGRPIEKDSRNFIYVAVLFWVLLDPLLSQDRRIELFTSGIIAETLLYVSIFLAMVSLGYQMTPSRKLKNAYARISEPENGTQIFLPAVLLFLIGAIPILYYSGGSLNVFFNILLAGYNWGVDAGWRRGAQGSSLDYLFTVFFLLLNVAPFLALWALMRGSLNFVQNTTLVSIILSVPVFYFFSGSRRMFAFFVLGLALYFYNAISSHKRKKWGVFFALAPILLFLAMQAQVQFRVGGFYDFDVSRVETNLDSLHRDDIFYWMLTAVDVMPARYPFTGGLPFFELLTHPIPRFLWPGKPISEGFPFVSWEDTGASLTISVIGQFYIAQGLFGVIIAGLIYGWAARNWDELIRMAPDGSVRSLIYYMGGVLFFVVGIRSFGDIVNQWYSIGFLFIVLYFFCGFKPVRRVPRLGV